jgi:hypothetical protein
MANERHGAGTGQSHAARREGGLVGAEQVAPGLRGYFDGTANVPRITQQLRLPAFRYSGNDPYAWLRPGMLKLIDVANAS